MISHAQVLNDAYRNIMGFVGQFREFNDRVAAYSKMVKLYGGMLFSNYYPVILSTGFQNLSRRPHVPANDEPPELTDFEWSKIKADLAHNVAVAKTCTFDKEDESNVSHECKVIFYEIMYLHLLKAY